MRKDVTSKYQKFKKKSLKCLKKCVILQLTSKDRASHGRRNFKDTNPLMSSLVIFIWGGENYFVGSESGQIQRVKLLQNTVYSTLQQIPPTPSPQPVSHTPRLYILYKCTFCKRRGGGEEVREKVEGQQYTSIVPSSMGAIVHKLN
jgi:hypothetical protein